LLPTACAHFEAALRPVQVRQRDRAKMRFPIGGLELAIGAQMRSAVLKCVPGFGEALDPVIKRHDRGDFLADGLPGFAVEQVSARRIHRRCHTGHADLVQRHVRTAERFDDRLFSREARGQRQRLVAVGAPLFRSEDATAEAVAVALGERSDAFHFDDVRALPAATTPAGATSATDLATYRTFDGQVIEFTGHREGDKAFVAISARRDPALAAKFPEPAPAPATSPPAATPVPAAPATPAKLPDQTAETLGARAQGMEYEIPAYKYEAIFKKQEELLEKPAPAPAKAAKAAKPAAK